MTIYELNKYMNERIPKTLSCSWDNDGLMCCPDGSREVRKAEKSEKHFFAWTLLPRLSIMLLMADMTLLFPITP